MKLNLELLKTATILYVEDEEIVRESTYQTFAKLFKKVYLAEDGQEGLEIFQKYKDEIELIVTDINLPNINGMEMIKAITNIKHLPIIITTAHSEQKYLLEAIELDIDKFVTKPAKIKELVIDIANLIESYRKEQQIKQATISLAAKTKEINSENKNLELKLDQMSDEIKLLKTLNDHYISIIYTDKQAVITDVSTKFCKLYGYDKDEIIGKKITAIQDDEQSSSKIQKDMLDAIYSKKSINSIHDFKTKDGEKLKCDMMMTPHFKEDGYIDGYTFYQDLLHI